MGLSVVTQPTQEPLSIGETKHHLRVDGSTDDQLIEGLISVARCYAETRTRRTLVTTTHKYTLDQFPPVSRCIKLPVPPVQSVTSVKYYDTDGSLQTFSSASYTVDTENEPARVCLAPNNVWASIQTDRANAVEITFIAGYGGPASVPQAIKAAMLLHIGHLYENRAAVITGTIATQVPLGVDHLLDSYSFGSYV